MADQPDDPGAEPRFICPACGEPGVAYEQGELDLPHFGRVVQMIVKCPGCNFRTSRLHFMEEKEPTRVTLTVREPEDLRARVVRSNTGRVLMPDLGFEMQPRDAAESFVTNIEGLLERVAKAIRTAVNLVGTEEAEAHGETLLVRVESFRASEEHFTIVIEDPHGTSGILHPRVKREAFEVEAWDWESETPADEADVDDDPDATAA